MAGVADTAPPPPPGTSRRVLRKSREDRVIAGVCGGIGRYFGIDPTVVRLAFVILTIAGGGGLIAYLIALLVIPEETPGEEVGGPPMRHDFRGDTAWLFFGVALIALGTILLIDRVIPWFDRIIGPIVLVGIGIALLLHGAKQRR